MAYLNQKLLREDIEKYLRVFAETYCKKGEANITKLAHYAMQEFYRDYTPKYYDRTYDLYDPKKKHKQSNGSVIPYYHNNGDAIYGGVKISSENMSLYQPFSANPTDPFEVASFAWNGWHGHPLRDIYMSPTPLEIVRKMMNKKRFLYEMRIAAERVATSQKYSILKFK